MFNKHNYRKRYFPKYYCLFVLYGINRNLKKKKKCTCNICYYTCILLTMNLIGLPKQMNKLRMGTVGVGALEFRCGKK